MVGPGAIANSLALLLHRPMLQPCKERGDQQACDTDCSPLGRGSAYVKPQALNKEKDHLER